MSAVPDAIVVWKLGGSVLAGADAYEEALAAHGMKLAPARVIEKPYSLASGREGMRVLMADARESACA